jgi:glycosyltransferase involved in cell wall biosynthesis
MLEAMSSRVGVILRTRNRPEFLARALADIAAQSFTDRSVIVVNDGGDTSVVDDIVDASGLGDSVRVIHIAPGEGGRCVAANAGVRAADTEFVVLHDDDDFWDAAFLAETVAWLDANPDDGGVAAATEIVYQERRDGAWVEVGRAPFWAGTTRISLGELLGINRAVPIAVLYRRALHAEVGWYDESLDAVEDWEFYLRAVPQHPFGFLGGKPLAFWTQRPDARGHDANSMFGLSEQHERDDAVVRDRALAEWIRREGAGLPLQIGGLEQRLAARADRLEEEIRALKGELRRELDAHQPVWRRLRALRRRLGGRRSD